MKNPNNEVEDAAKQRFALALLWHLGAKSQHGHRFIRLALILPLCILILLAGIWTLGIMYGMKYEVQGTVISARSSDTQIAKVINQKTGAYRLTLIYPDGKSHVYSLKDLGMSARLNTSLILAKQKQSAWQNRLQWWRPLSYPVIIGVNGQLLQDFVNKNTTITITPPQDATLTINGDKVQLTEGADGKQYGLNDPVNTILKSASKLDARPLRMKEIIQHPAITAESLAPSKAKVEQIIKQPVTFTIAGEQVHPSTAQIASWLVLAPNPAQKTVDVSVNLPSVQAYINQIARARNRAPRNQINLATGGTIAGSEGQTVTSTDAATVNVVQNLTKAEGVKADLPVQRTPFKVVNGYGGGKWIEVDLSAKRLHAYDQGGLLQTFLISAGAAGTPTVTGTYSIYSKYASQTMSGPNSDGSRYVQPNVPWINYFYRDYAIHGNYWRPTSYFGNVNSSHGCVGLKTGDAYWLYAWAPVGTTVVIHY